MSHRLAFRFAVLLLISVVSSVGLAADWAEPGDYVVVGVIGASFEGAQAPSDFAVAPDSWYWGGYYKTWVDFIEGMQTRDYRWVNYARAGDVSVHGAGYLEQMVLDTTFLFSGDEPQTSVQVLVIGFWGNDFLWFPGYNQDALDAMIANVHQQIELARAAGIEKIIVLGWPGYDAFDLDAFTAMFPEALPFHIDESGYEQSKDYFYQEFAQPNPDYLFVEPWCGNFQTFDGVHPAEATSHRAAVEVRRALHRYDRVIGHVSLTCR